MMGFTIRHMPSTGIQLLSCTLTVSLQQQSLRGISLDGWGKWVKALEKKGLEAGLREGTRYQMGFCFV